MVYISFDAGSTHCGNPAWAKELIEVARDAKADAIKFQLGTSAPNIPMEAKHWEMLCDYANSKQIDIYASCFQPKFMGWYLETHTGPKIIKFAYSQRKDIDMMKRAKRSDFQVIASCDHLSDRAIEHVSDVRLFCIPQYPLYFEPNWEGIFDGGRFHGFSCHAMGYSIPHTAVMKGADYLEVHLTLDYRESKMTPDGGFAYKPRQAKELVRRIKGGGVL